MSDAQWTVTGLLLLLLALEIVRIPQLKTYFQALWQTFNQGLSAASGSKP